MRRNRNGQFVGNNAIMIPLPRWRTTILILIVIVLLLPWVRIIYDKGIIEKVMSFFDSNKDFYGTCKQTETNGQGSQKSGGIFG